MGLVDEVGCPSPSVGGGRPVRLRRTVIAAGGLGAAQGPQKLEDSRCSDMHSQPYLRAK